MAVKKVVDKWKLKKWYNVFAPPLFDQKEIGETVANDEKALINRIIRTRLADVIGSGSQSAMYTSLDFRINEVKDTRANTTLIGHEVSPSYIKTFARRGKTLVHQVVDVPTKDNETVRLKLILVTVGKISQNTKKNLRKALVDEIKKETASLSTNEVFQEIIYGKLVSKLFNSLKSITAIRRIEIRSSEKKEIFG